MYNFFRWEDGNNLTSNLFTLITPLTAHKNTSDIHVCSYKPYIYHILTLLNVLTPKIS